MMKSMRVFLLHLKFYGDTVMTNSREWTCSNVIDLRHTPFLGWNPDLHIQNPLLEHSVFSVTHLSIAGRHPSSRLPIIADNYDTYTLSFKTSNLGIFILGNRNKLKQLYSSCRACENILQVGHISLLPFSNPQNWPKPDIDHRYSILSRNYTKKVNHNCNTWDLLTLNNPLINHLQLIL